MSGLPRRRSARSSFSWADDGSRSFREQAEEFGREMAGLLSATLPGVPDPPVEIEALDQRAGAG
jgi:hypothetical protein